MDNNFRSRRGTGDSGGSNHIDSKILFLVVLTAGALIGGGASYLGMNTLGGEISAQEAGNMVATTLSETSNVDYSVADVREEDGVYRVQLKANNQLTNYYYVTKNGKFFSTAMTNIEQVQSTLDSQEELEKCLDRKRREKNLTMYGNLSSAQTRLQLQALGGPQRVSDYYEDVNNPQNLAEAVNRGVRSTPAFIFEGDILTGVNNITSVSEFAGCSQ